MTPLLLLLIAAGLAAVGAGWFLRTRKVRAEHWMWKKQRLRRARLLAAAGGVLAMLSTAVLLLDSPGLPA